MSEKKENIPKIRFPGFTGSWEQRKLGEVAEFSKGSGYTKNDLSESGSPIILYGRLYTKYETVINDVDTFTELKDKSVISEGNEVVVPSSGETAEDISRASVVGKSGFILGGDLNIIKPKQEIDPIFLALTISNGAQQKKISKRAQGKSVVHLHNSDLKQVNLLYPKLKEQQQIGKFFLELDNLITLHQRKLKNMQNLKAGLLQKMFPKKGEDLPEVRFPEFTSAWEQRKLGEITNIKTGSSDLQDAVDDGEYPFFVRSENVERSNRYIFDGEAILIPGEGRLGDIYHYINGKFDYHQRVYKISDFEGSITDGKFVLYYLQQNFKRHAIKFTVKATVDSLRLPMLVDFEIILPSFEEQIQIGNLFANLDHLITLHQRKIKHLQEQKKALLQQMFV